MCEDNHYLWLSADIILSALFHEEPSQQLQLVVAITMHIWQVRKLKHWEVKQLVQDYLTHKKRSQDLNLAHMHFDLL
jgi:hypothetical protein